MHLIAAATIDKLVDQVGPILGIVAFVVLAVLAFLLFQEAREVRRLRDWAGRAPERAAEAAEAEVAAGEARDEAEHGPPPGRWERFKDGVGGAREGVSGRLGPRWEELDRRSPVDPRIVIVLIIGVIVAAVATSGFGLLSSSGENGKATVAKTPGHVKVAVLNGTQEPGVPAVPHLASEVEKQVVKPAGYGIGPVTNAPESFTKSVVMFRSGHEQDAKALATAVNGKLGKTGTKPMTKPIQSTAKPARLALVIGLDDSSFGR